MTLNVRPPGDDFRPENLLESNVGMELIYFNIFDEFMVDLVEDERDRDYEIHQRRERNWLGGFSMPFTALYEQTRVKRKLFILSFPHFMIFFALNSTHRWGVWSNFST